MADEPGERTHGRVGTRVREKYRIDAFIATGSMANVYAATHRNGSRVALKILHKELAGSPAMAERFRREGYFANAIGHPGIVRAIDDDVAEDGCAFLVMELLEGESLEERRVRMGGKLQLPDVLKIGDAMLEILAAAHRHEILHRDLKPANVYITRKNEIKLLDFGVARFNDGLSASDMTETGMVLGTPAFMPPEQALGRRQDVDVRSDIWGVGATLFMILTGQSVHIGGDAKTKLIATARTPARPLRTVLPEAPRAVASVIDRALAFDRAERWADAAAMREALRWARMSLDTTPLASDDSTDGAPTLRRDEAPPTLTGRSPLESFSEEEKSTATRRDALSEVRASVAAEAAQGRPPGGEDVTTSGPPPTSVARNDDATFARAGAVDAPTPAMPFQPITERMAREGRGRPSDLVQVATAATLPADGFGHAPSGAASVQRLATVDNGPATGRATDVMAQAPPPPPDSAVVGTAPMAAMPSVAALYLPEPPSSVRPTFPSVGDLPMLGPTPPPGPVMSERRVRAPRPSLTPEDPGPLLSTIAPKRGGRLFRVFIPAFFGVLTGLATYTLVLYQRAAKASHAAHPEPPSSSAPAASSALSAAVAAVSALPAAAPSASAPSASASAAVAAGGPPSAAASSAAPKRRPRPRPRHATPSAPVPAPETAASEPPPPAATSSPAPVAPAPAPPAPQDSLPRKEDD